MKQELITQIEKIIKDPTSSEKDIFFQLKNMLYETEFQSSNVRESKSISNLVAENLNLLRNGRSSENVIKSGFQDFDKLFGGFSLGEFVVIGGRPAMGKTQLLVNLALNISTTRPILYFTFDLSQFLLTNRFISSLSTISAHKILQQNLTQEEKNILMAVESKFNQYQLYINDSCNNSISNFASHCKKQIEENGVKVIFVDYLQMMSSNKYRNNRELEISHISRELKSIAKDYNVCIIAASQLSRAVEMRGGIKHPHLSDLRESGAIEQDADKVLFIYRPEYYGLTLDEDGNNTEGLTELILAKNRNGSLGTTKLQRSSNFTNYRDFEGYNNEFTFSKNRLNEIDIPF